MSYVIRIHNHLKPGQSGRSNGQELFFETQHEAYQYLAGLEIPVPTNWDYPQYFYRGGV